MHSSAIKNGLPATWWKVGRIPLAVKITVIITETDAADCGVDTILK